MRRVLLVALLIVVLGTAACAGASGGNGGSGSGISGTVVAGPQCPVERPDSPCPGRPVKASVQISTADGSRVVKLIQTDASGNFSVSIEPGTYQIQALPEGTDALFSKPQSVTVQAGAFTPVQLVLDTGIR